MLRWLAFLRESGFPGAGAAGPPQGSGQAPGAASLASSAEQSVPVP
jgi:hypothetical protein